MKTDDVYVSPTAGGSIGVDSKGGCTVGQNCNWGFATVAVVGVVGAVVVAVYNPPAIVVATLA